ncbi:XrtA-associated tyrosine autokinase [Nitrosomonas sp. ANs5]|uniref:XrtA-associated tyrosine autokinase n=1 Tax=Nitrosomonas sp. ANs5 TaxID=3423941 RepID=UPI003D344B0D
MSLIERAAGKLDKKNRSSKTTQMPLQEGDTSSPIPLSSELLDGVPKSESGQDAKTRDTTQTAKRIEIDLDGLHDKGIVTPHHTKSLVAEQFRLIKRPLLSNAFNENSGIKHGNLIMVTSSLAGEGKSFCSVNLAMSIAMEMDHRVLLVDADVARPSIPRTLSFNPDMPGLLDIILDPKLTVSDILIKTNVEKLTLIPAGARHSHSTELLASQSMHAILEELAQRYHDRIVIFDSPPLLLTSEARVLASQMGQIVLVVEAERTTQQTVKEALRQIESCDVINLIYNKARTSHNAGYYGYYY